MKHCPHCNRTLPLDHFYDAPRGRLKKQSWCKECAAAARYVSYRAHTTTRLLRLYGITQADYDRMHEQQGGVCAICGQPERIVDHRSNTVKSLAVDHDHATGKVRALVCSACNVLLGHAGDDPAILRKAATYLEACTREEAA